MSNERITPSSGYMRFYEELTAGSEVLGTNGAARQIFQYIQMAFTPTMRPSPVSREVHRDLVANLAACADVILDYDSPTEIPLRGSMHSDVLGRVVEGFICTLARAIQKGEVKSVGGVTRFNCFTIPPWFVEWVKTWKVVAGS